VLNLTLSNGTFWAEVATASPQIHTPPPKSAPAAMGPQSRPRSRQNSMNEGGISSASVSKTAAMAEKRARGGVGADAPPFVVFCCSGVALPAAPLS